MASLNSDISPTFREIAPWMGHAPIAVIEGSCGLHTGLRAFWKNTPSSAYREGTFWGGRSTGALD